MRVDVGTRMVRAAVRTLATGVSRMGSWRQLILRRDRATRIPVRLRTIFRCAVSVVRRKVRRAVSSRGAIVALALVGCRRSSVEVVAEHQFEPHSVVGDADGTYWANLGDGTIWRT